MELARQLEQESRIKATMDLRKLRGDDDDKDQDAIRALEEIEMDKINLNKLKIAKQKKKANKKKPEKLLEKFEEESLEEKKEDLMKLFKKTLASQMKADKVDVKT